LLIENIVQTNNNIKKWIYRQCLNEIEKKNTYIWISGRDIAVYMSRKQTKKKKQMKLIRNF